MACSKHASHDHGHGKECGHTAVMHGGHTDYIHDGHLHHDHDGHTDEHELDATGDNPERCATGHACQAHDPAHEHRTGCGHEAVPHAGHVDYVVAGHLHNRHAGHCDDHGPLKYA